MKDLKDYIYQKDSSEKSYELIKNMISDNTYVELEVDKLIKALSIDGEIFIVQMSYDDYDSEMKTSKLRYLISQALSVVVSYEDDSKQSYRINKFANYIKDISDEYQNSIFGVKKVDKLSSMPITILFSGVLPINQLEMGVCKDVWEFINSDDDYFKPRFKKLRDDISKDCGVRILPLLPYFDKTLKPLNVSLKDIKENKIITEFEVIKNLNKETIEIYLEKIKQVYLALCKN